MNGEKFLPIGLFGYQVFYDHTDTWLNFRTYKIIAIELSGSQKTFDSKFGKWTTDLNEAKEYLSGYVKWDGCLEITEQENSHFCGRENIQEFCDLLRELHSLCLLLPGIDKECAGY